MLLTALLFCHAKHDLGKAYLGETPGEKQPGRWSQLQAGGVDQQRSQAGRPGGCQVAAAGLEGLPRWAGRS